LNQFWHGKNFLQGKIPQTNTEYWAHKLQRNIERDKQVNATLIHNGWIVLRYWEKDIKQNITSITDQIEQTVIKRKKVLRSKMVRNKEATSKMGSIPLDKYPQISQFPLLQD